MQDTIELKEQIRKLSSSIRWLEEQVIDREVPQSKRMTLYLCLTQHLQLLADSILVLLQENRTNGAFALARPLLEAYIKAIWILECADDSKVCAIYEDKINFPKISEAIQSIKKSASDHARWIKMSEKALKPLHDFVHGGIQTCIRHFDGKNVRLNYPISHRLDLLESFVKPILFNNGVELLTRLGLSHQTILEAYARVVGQQLESPSG